jgi:hypothetical protein
MLHHPRRAPEGAADRAPRSRDRLFRRMRNDVECDVWTARYRAAFCCGSRTRCGSFRVRSGSEAIRRGYDRYHRRHPAEDAQSLLASPRYASFVSVIESVGVAGDRPAVASAADGRLPAKRRDGASRAPVAGHEPPRDELPEPAWAGNPRVDDHAEYALRSFDVRPDRLIPRLLLDTPRTDLNPAERKADPGHDCVRLQRLRVPARSVHRGVCPARRAMGFLGVRAAAPLRP